jgi:nucleotide-binding universal stress UspA family protein
LFFVSALLWLCIDASKPLVAKAAIPLVERHA